MRIIIEIDEGAKTPARGEVSVISTERAPSAARPSATEAETGPAISAGEAGPLTTGSVEGVAQPAAQTATESAAGREGESAGAAPLPDLPGA